MVLTLIIKLSEYVNKQHSTLTIRGTEIQFNHREEGADTLHAEDATACYYKLRTDSNEENPRS